MPPIVWWSSRFPDADRALRGQYGFSIVQGGDDRERRARAVLHPPIGRGGHHGEIDWRAPPERVISVSSCASSHWATRCRGHEAVGENRGTRPWITAEYFGDPSPEKFDDGWLRTGRSDRSTPGLRQITDRQGLDQIARGVISSVELETLDGAPRLVRERHGVPDPAGRAHSVRGGSRPRMSPGDLAEFLPRASRSAGTSGGASSRRFRRPASASSTRGAARRHESGELAIETL